MQWLKPATALLLSTGLAQADAPPLLLTGEVYSRQAQDIIVPLTNNWQARISVMPPEGTFLEQGETAVEFDGTEAARQLEQQRETARTELARTERDLARLAKELEQARFAADQARVTLDLTRMKADIPEGLIGSLEHSENQLAWEQAIKDQENAEQNLKNAEKALAERQKQARLDEEKRELNELWWQEMLDSFTVRAKQSGYILYFNHPWTRAKFQEGDNVQTSFRIAQVANTEDLAAKIWINGVDRPRVEVGAPVVVSFDALPFSRYAGHIESISSGGSKRNEWGKAIYFESIVVFDEPITEQLLPGMSVLVEVLP